MSTHGRPWPTPPPPVGRTTSMAPVRNRVAGIPGWIQRRTIRVDLLITGVDGNVERVVNTVVLDDE